MFFFTDKQNHCFKICGQLFGYYYKNIHLCTCKNVHLYVFVVRLRKNAHMFSIQFIVFQCVITKMKELFFYGL